ncbi:MAG: MoaD/ThiS family protein [Thermoanaerobaculia bacterium]
MKVRVVAFASAAEVLAGTAEEVELADAATVESLLDELTRRRPTLGPLRARLAVALDGELVSPHAPLADGCEVALLPPVSGG